MGDRAIVGNPEDKSSFRAFPPEGRQGLPDCHRDLLKKIVTITTAIRVTRRESKQRGSICLQQAMKAFFQNRSGGLFRKNDPSSSDGIALAA